MHYNKNTKSTTRKEKANGAYTTFLKSCYKSIIYNNMPQIFVVFLNYNNKNFLINLLIYSSIIF